MSDITERLRDMACSQDALAPFDCFDDSELLVEAADEIERLRAALGRIEAMSAGSICNSGRPDIHREVRAALANRHD